MDCSTEFLPNFTGYAIGNIIPEDEILLPYLRKKRADLEKAKSEQENIRNQIKPQDKHLQSQYDECSWKIMQIENNINQYSTRIQEIIKNVPLVTIEEALPIDRKAVKLVMENNSFFSENLKLFLFTRNNEKEVLKEKDESIHIEIESKSSSIFYDRTIKVLHEDEIASQVSAFFSELFFENTKAQCLPPGSLESVVKSIERALKTTHEISLIGSFVTLPRVRAIDPFVLRKGAKISSQLCENAQKYYVLTEAILGAVFVGVGKHASGGTSGDSFKKSMTDIATLSFISQGVVPKVPKTFQEVSLWSLYSNWKEQLENDKNTGYPIRFKYRKLSDVLDCNQ